MIYFIRGGKLGKRYGFAEDCVRYVTGSEIRIEYFYGNYVYAYRTGREWRWIC